MFATRKDTLQSPRLSRDLVTNVIPNPNDRERAFRKTRASTTKRVGTALLLCIGLLLAGTLTASAATASVKGVVYCKGGHSVVGVWVESTGGGSTWAEWTPFAGRPYAAYYSATLDTALPTQIRLHVGCGGSYSTWWSNNRTPYWSISMSRTLNTICAEAAEVGTRCSWPAKGETRSTNPGAAGYCTWGAAEKWKTATSSYPNLSGNASKWGSSATNADWTVTPIPMARSIVVFPASSSNSFGHVAWVTGLDLKSDGVYINIIEMNYGPWTDKNAGKTVNFGKYTKRTVKHTNMTYILAPAAH